jgi:hypothetical protein
MPFPYQMRLGNHRIMMENNEDRFRILIQRRRTAGRSRACPGLRSLTDLRAWVIVFVGTELGYAGEVEK